MAISLWHHELCFRFDLSVMTDLVLLSFHCSHDSAWETTNKEETQREETENIQWASLRKQHVTNKWRSWELMWCLVNHWLLKTLIGLLDNKLHITLMATILFWKLTPLKSNIPFIIPFHFNPFFPSTLNETNSIWSVVKISFIICVWNKKDQCFRSSNFALTDVFQW